MRKTIPTIKDVAREAGVSAMTISRVCNPDESERVSDATRERVLQTIETLGYSPSAIAQSVRRGRIDTIGFYYGFQGPFLLDHDFLRRIYNGLQVSCSVLNQDLLLFYIPEESRSPADIVRELNTSNVDGIVFLPFAGDEKLAKLLGEAHKPVIAIAEAVPGLPAITAEDEEGSRRIARHLFERGHRRVFYRQSRSDLISSRRRREAFQACAQSLGMEVELLQPTEADQRLNPTERDRLKNSKRDGITALVAFRDFSALRVIQACREEGLRVPEDIAIAGFDGISHPICPENVTLTTIQVPWSEIARKAAAYLVDRARRRDYSAPPTVVTVESPLFIGNTT